MSSPIDLNCFPELVTYCLWFERQIVSLVELHIFVESPLLKRTQRMEFVALPPSLRCSMHAPPSHPSPFWLPSLSRAQDGARCLRPICCCNWMPI